MLQAKVAATDHEACREPQVLLERRRQLSLCQSALYYVNLWYAQLLRLFVFLVLVTRITAPPLSSPQSAPRQQYFATPLSVNAHNLCFTTWIHAIKNVKDNCLKSCKLHDPRVLHDVTYTTLLKKFTHRYLHII